MEVKKTESRSRSSNHHHRQRVLCFLLCLSSTINVLFSWSYLKNNRRKWESLIGGLSWSKEATEEAEAVALISCSGHGTAFLDGTPDEKSASCECNACFTGPDCSHQLPSADCVADADSGNPLFLESFWRNHASSGAVLVSGWHRMSYTFGANSRFSAELEKHIRALHASVGNAVTQGKFILFGTGSTQLVNAAVHALSLTMLNESSHESAASSSSSRSSPPVKVVVAVPYYQAYEYQTDFFRSDLYEWGGDASVWSNCSSCSSTDRFIELVTSPNNPDSQLKRAVLTGPNVRHIHDHAYYWPHFTSISTPADEDLMLFTLSKLSGHAGSRFGWAVVKDEAVYWKMMRYMVLNTFGVSHETQLRALEILKVILEKGGGRKEIFEFGYETMSERWRRLSRVFTSSRRFSLQVIHPEFCNFTGRVKEPSPAYAWLKCNREEDEDCYQVFLSAGIIGRDGRVFGGTDGHRYLRLSLLKSKDDFDILIYKIEKFVFSENLHYGHESA